MLRIAINAVGAKKIAGGGFQISLNFVKTALSDRHHNIDLYFFLSKDLAYTLNVHESDHIFIFPTQPNFFNSWLGTQRALHKLEKDLKLDIIYSIIAPSYFSFDTQEVMRCTNAWAVQPNKYALAQLSRIQLLRNWLKYSLIRKLMRKCAYFITQTDSIAISTAKVARVPLENVCVVNNVLPAAFNEYNRIKNLDREWYDIVSVAAPFPHKDLEIIPYVLKEIRDNHNIPNIRMHVTLPSGSTITKRIEKNISAFGLTDNFVNHGRVNQQQLASIYCSCRMMFMPTLLETFSASLLEAMFFDLSIVTSDLSFNSDITKDAALYFRPHDYADAAIKIAELINNETKASALIEKYNDILPNYCNYQKHYDSTIDFLVKVANIKK